VPQYSETPLFSFALPAGLFRFAAAAVLGGAFLTGGSGLTAPAAHAQTYFGYWDAPPPKPRKPKRRPVTEDAEAAEAETGKKAKGETVAERPIVGPLVINVSLSKQRLSVYDATGKIADSPVSSGRVGYSTPTGVFSVLEKRRQHFSNLYAGASMPNMQRLTWSGVALHAGVLPGFPASHGCIRLPHGFSKKLFGMTKSGTRVIVSRDPVAPAPFEHERLFAAYPPEEDPVTGSVDVKTTRVADASGAGKQRSDSMSSVLGVTAAAAAGADDTAHPQAQLSYRERRQAESERLNGEIRTAGYAKAEKAFLLTRANEVAKAAREPFLKARVEEKRLAEELETLETSLKRAERELADLQAPEEEPKKGRKPRKPKKVDTAKRAARIAELEARIAARPQEIVLKRNEWEAAVAASKAVEGAAGEAEATRRAALTEYMAVSNILSAALEREQAAKRRDAKRSLPVSVFISRSKQRLYVRQGYSDIFDVEVQIDRPDEPIGTHVFTALDYTDSKTAMTWSAVSIPHDPTRAPSKKKKDKSANAKPVEPVAAVPLASQTPEAALDRITIPPDAREQIADVMKPGSSLVISDLGIGNETGKYTDFIVPIR